MKIFRLLTMLLLLGGCVQQTGKTEPFFCPNDHCEARVANAIMEAHSTLDIAIYSFTSEKLSEEIMKAKNRGVRIRIVADYLQSKNKSSTLEELSQNGIEVRFLPNYQTMHNKFMVADSSITLTGSYNWTQNANESNSENIVFIFDEKTAELFEKEFFQLWISAG